MSIPRAKLEDELYKAGVNDYTFNDDSALIDTVRVAGTDTASPACGALPDKPVSTRMHGARSPSTDASHILLVRETAEMGADRALVICADIFLRYDDWTLRMLESIADHATLDELLAIAVERLDNPLAVFDRDLIELATAGTFRKSPAGTIWEYFEQGVLAYTGFYTLDEHRALVRNSETYGSTPFFYKVSADRVHTYGSFLIEPGGKTAGSVGTVDVNAPFTESQKQVLRVVSGMLQRLFSSSESLMSIAERGSSGIEQLLSGDDPSPRLVKQYLDARSWKQTDRYLFASFDCPLELSGPLESRAFIRIVSPLFPTALFSVHEGQVVAIVHRDDWTDALWLETLASLAEVLERNDMCAGLSMEYRRFDEMRIFACQASFASRRARALVEHADDTALQAALAERRDEAAKRSADPLDPARNPGDPPGRRILTYRACYQEHLRVCLEGQADLSCFCDPTIRELWDSGSEGDRELIRTLRAFLLDGRSIASASRDLNVHRNTFIYRLEKLERILDRDLRTIDPSDALVYLCTCLILEGGPTDAARPEADG